MIDQEMRRTILALNEAGQSQRTIARMMGVSRSFVQRLIQRGTEEVPERSAASILFLHLERVRAEVGLCKGNLIRVQEELVADGVEVSYSASGRQGSRPASCYKLSTTDTAASSSRHRTSSTRCTHPSQIDPVASSSTASFALI